MDIVSQAVRASGFENDPDVTVYAAKYPFHVAVGIDRGDDNSESVKLTPFELCRLGRALMELAGATGISYTGPVPS
ncbi:hypothetical protein [Rhodococcus koreensis]